MKPQYYAVRVKKSKRYLSWIDERWYGTTAEFIPLCTKEQFEHIAELLQSHFIFRCEFVKTPKAKRMIHWQAFGAVHT